MLGLLAVGLLPGSALALTGVQKITFGEYGEGEPISAQYEPEGVVFDEEDGFYPEIVWDNSSYENPVLSGPFGFGSTISAKFVEPGTTTPAAVENLAMDVGYVNEPGSTELTIERTTGPFTLFANEYGFNHLFLTGGGITGFKVETISEEPAGWEIDNLEYTIPAPAPPAPAPAGQPAAPANNCLSTVGGLWHQVWENLKCKLAPELLVGKCAVGIALDFPDGKALKAADGLYEVAKVDKKYKAAAKLYNKLKTTKILPDAPKGYQTFPEIIGKLHHAKTVGDIVEMMPSLYHAFGKKAWGDIFNDLIDLAGVRPCVQLFTD
ncbi:MAG: hypothetical protein ACTHKT_01660 [Solirubrobacterales bacterium]